MKKLLLIIVTSLSFMSAVYAGDAVTFYSFDKTGYSANASPFMNKNKPFKPIILSNQLAQKSDIYASRRAYKNNRKAYRNNRQINLKNRYRANPNMRGNIYLPAKGKKYGPSQQGNIIINNQGYRHHNHQGRGRHINRQRDRWINNRYYRWYIPAAGYLIYQGQPCYIDDVGSGRVDDQNQCCNRSLNLCSDDFLIPNS